MNNTLSAKLLLTGVERIAFGVSVPARQCEEMRVEEELPALWSKIVDERARLLRHRKRGCFAVFMPGEPHKPELIAVGEPDDIKKW
ncbi:hypothetical protein KCP70_08235 [Salmonella enterica subsp. enterica]|nr:hypothetical protein KCP70_08235 [Salmonella enterica subsp. enterica]